MTENNLPVTLPEEVTQPVTIGAEWVEKIAEYAKAMENLNGWERTGDWYDQAALKVKEAGSLERQMEKERKGLSKPFQDAGKAIKKVVDDALAGLREGRAKLKTAMGEHMEALRLEDERRKGLDAHTGAAGDEVTADVVPVGGKPVTPHVKVVDTVSFEVVDPGSVVRDLCSPDPAKIREMVNRSRETFKSLLEGMEGRSTTEFIPGVRVFIKRDIRG